MQITIGTITVEYNVYKTNAPKNYDGFGTIEVYSSKPDRLVLIRTEDERWQTTRYSSGLHSAELMKDDFMNEDIERILWDRINVSMGS